ncbi:hypothetical protein P20311_1571 [Pseudoalteromonas sp. BSi20311]|nr:hypothetical protein P20311_1571 [Pseudoalteromonas sp. BSi20311]GAA71515.1 hypothetical protein P20439_1589 [Pseudoalteromonas sp. BSi20439]
MGVCNAMSWSDNSRVFKSNALSIMVKAQQKVNFEHNL